MNNALHPFEELSKRAQRMRQLFTENAREYTNGAIDVATFAVTEAPAVLYEHGQAVFSKFVARFNR